MKSQHASALVLCLTACFMAATLVCGMAASWAATSTSSASASSTSSSASAASSTSASASASTSASADTPTGAELSAAAIPNVYDVLNQYRYDDSVNQFLFVRAEEGSNAHIQFLVKEYDPRGDPLWTIDRECEGYIGKDGLGAVHDGTTTTPVGVFSVITAFGIKANPGTSMDYIDITDDINCCGDREYYNQIISSKETGHTCTECEHMIDYSPMYNYGMFIDYNKDCVYGEGSAIFIHCIGLKPYTGGCVAMPEEDMKYILQHSDKGIKVCIMQF